MAPLIFGEAIKGYLRGQERKRQRFLEVAEEKRREQEAARAAKDAEQNRAYKAAFIESMKEKNRQTVEEAKRTAMENALEPWRKQEAQLTPESLGQFYAAHGARLPGQEVTPASIAAILATGGKPSTTPGYFATRRTPLDVPQVAQPFGPPGSTTPQTPFAMQPRQLDYLGMLT